MKNVKELRDMTVEELKKQEASLRESLFKFRYQLKNNMLDSPMKMPETKRQIARILTIIREKEASAEK